MLFSFNSYADKTLNIAIQEGSIEIKELLDSYKIIADSTFSKYVNKAIPGTIVDIQGKQYEIRFFSFEDTSGKLPNSMSFQEYLTKNDLLALKSIITKPETGIIFQSFSSRSTALDDGVYFGIGLRLVD